MPVVLVFAPAPAVMATASPATDPSGSIVGYSIFQMGARMVNAYEAAYSTATQCANLGLDISNDLLGIEHYGGRAYQAPDGSFYIEGLDGLDWDGTYDWTAGYIWNDEFI